MCIPGSETIVGTIAGLAKDTFITVNKYNQEKENNNIRMQIALNNAKTAQTEANKQKQYGIDKSRMEKISSIREASRINARNSANGLLIDMGTNELEYQNVLDMGEINADEIEEHYNNLSDNYFTKANNYLDDAKRYKKNYNKSIFSNSFNALGKIGKVAPNWFEDKGEI